MFKEQLATASSETIRFLAKHKPEILTGLGITGMISSTVMAVSATPKAIIIIKNKKMESEANDLTTSEIIKAPWKCYIPATIVGVTSILCLISANSTNYKRNAALATAYALSERTLSEYRKKVISEIGEEKERDIKTAISKERIQNNPVQTQQIIITNKGNTPCYDPIIDRYFKSDIETIKKTVNELNRRMREEHTISLNDFYYELGLKSIDVGDNLGWNIDRGYIDVEFTSHLDPNGTPCLELIYKVIPIYEF